MEIGSTQIIALLITGVGVGFASGLLGVGGCFIMVPVQFWALTSIGVDPTIAIRIAFGTNLAVVLPTAISGAIGHNRKKVVLWKAGIVLGLAGLVGSVVGGYFAAHIPGNILKIGFGLAILAGGIRMLTAKPPKIEKEPIDNVLVYILWGFPLGIVSGIIGIGDSCHEIQNAPISWNLNSINDLYLNRRNFILYSQWLKRFGITSIFRRLC